MYVYAVENRRKNWYTGEKHTRNQKKQLITSIVDCTDLQWKTLLCDAKPARKNPYKKYRVLGGCV